MRILGPVCRYLWSKPSKSMANFCFHTSKGQPLAALEVTSKTKDNQINASGIYKVYICICIIQSLAFFRCLEGHPKLQICHALEKSILPLLSASLSSSLLVCLCVSEAARTKSLEKRVGGLGWQRRPRPRRLLERLFSTTAVQRNRMRFSWLKIMQLY